MNIKKNSYKIKLIQLQKFLLAFLLLLCTTGCLSDQGNEIPAFTITKTDGKIFHASNIPVGKPVFIIYFSPECDHCTIFMKQWFSRVRDFSKASVVMITFLQIEKVKQFEKDYGTAQYTNFTVGTEGLSFFVRNYYKLTDMPFAALYDKQGKQVSTHQKEIPLDVLAAALKKM